MKTLPIVQIRTTPTVLNFEAKLGEYSIRQPKAELQMQTKPAQLTVESYPIELSIDQSRAFSAYTGGTMAEMNDRIYSGIQQLFLQNLGERVEQGNQLAAIHKPGNTVVNIVGSDWQARPFPESRGPASSDNVDVRFTTRQPDLHYEPAVSELNVIVNKPEIEYHRGIFDAYVKQYGSIQYTPPAIDMGL
ncbi:DUF6470 family protein [Paenibacillus sp. Z3-2]